ncbi:MAG: hypothetical protein ACXV8O_01530 [Methylobacter sp.]
MKLLLKLLDDHFSDAALCHDQDETRRLHNMVKERLSMPDPEPYEIDWPEYHEQGMGCGLEDRNITDRYEAMRYGWDCALDAVAQVLPETIYTSPRKREIGELKE